MPRSLPALLALTLTACASRAPVELSAPFKIEPVPGMLRLCVPMFPDAGRFPKAEAERWRAARAALLAGDGAAAVAELAAVKPHPARDAVGLAATLIAEDVGVEPALDPLLERWPQDPCLRQLAAVHALQAQDRAGAAEHVRVAVSQDAADPDARLLGLVLASEDPAALAAQLIEAADAAPDHVATQVLAGQAAVHTQDLPAALRAFKRAEAAGVPDADAAVFHLLRMTGDLEAYLGKALDGGLPVSGPEFGATDRVARYETWLGIQGDQHLDAVFDTSAGTLRCTLLHRAAPVTVINFVGLALGEQPWVDPNTQQLGQGSLYEGTLFHRVIPEFMIQGGDPLGSGEGGPGYRFPDELTPGLDFAAPGLLAMANSGPDTNGSQFFITEAPAPHLNGLHTIFGRCDEPSVEVVKAIARAPADHDDRPSPPVELRSIVFELHR